MTCYTEVGEGKNDRVFAPSFINELEAVPSFLIFCLYLQRQERISGGFSVTPSPPLSFCL